MATVKQPQPNETEPVEIGNVTARRVYLASPHKTGAAYVWPAMSWSERHESSRTDGATELVNLSGMRVEDPDGEWYLLAESDCHDPPIYAVRANGWEAAYETFVEEFATVLSEPDIADYEPDDERLTHTSRRPVDTESIHGWETRFLRADGA